MIVMAYKEEEGQRDELPSYSSPAATDGYDFVPEKKERPDPDPDPPRTHVSTSSVSRSGPSYEPTPSPSSYYAPSPGQPAALTTNSSTTPISFSRTPSQGPSLTYASFKPMFLLAASNKSTSLSKGFPFSPPPSKDVPHPFVTHDINEIDWLQFLNDVQAAGSLTEKDIQRSHIPIVSILPFIGDLSTYGVQKFMKSRKYTTVAKTLEIWNHHFFEPRKIRIVLMRGNERLSGLQERAIEALHTPEPVNVSSGIMEHAIGSSNGRKGKGKEESDDLYRLFVLSL